MATSPAPESAPRVLVVDDDPTVAEVVSRYRRLREVAPIPVIMLTARGDESDRGDGPRPGGRRLRHQALLASGAAGQGQVGAATGVGRAGPGVGRPEHPAGREPGGGGAGPGSPHLGRRRQSDRARVRAPGLSHAPPGDGWNVRVVCALVLGPRLGLATESLQAAARRLGNTDGTLETGPLAPPVGAELAAVARELERGFDLAFRREQARTPDADNRGGLGLAIAKGLVAAHSGEIAVTNDGFGCRFTVRLPLPPP